MSFLSEEAPHCILQAEVHFLTQVHDSIKKHICDEGIRRFVVMIFFFFFFKETAFSAEIKKIKKYKLSLIEPQIIILIIFNKILQPHIY